MSKALGYCTNKQTMPLNTPRTDNARGLYQWYLPNLLYQLFIKQIDILSHHIKLRHSTLLKHRNIEIKYLKIFTVSIATQNPFIPYLNLI